jgi:hypothetical protein
MMKTNTQNYANVITNILRKYRLPELYNIIQDIPTKANWKKEIKDKIQEYWEKQWFYQKVFYILSFRITKFTDVSFFIIAEFRLFALKHVCSC